MLIFLPSTSKLVLETWLGAWSFMGILGEFSGISESHWSNWAHSPMKHIIPSHVGYYFACLEKWWVGRVPKIPKVPPKTNPREPHELQSWQTGQGKFYKLTSIIYIYYNFGNKKTFPWVKPPTKAQLWKVKVHRSPLHKKKWMGCWLFIHGEPGWGVNPRFIQPADSPTLLGSEFP